MPPSVPPTPPPPPRRSSASIPRNPRVHLEESRGTFSLFAPVTGVSLTRARGHLSLTMVEGWMEAIEPDLQRGVVFDSFHDWEEMESYDSEARRILTGWALRSRGSVRSTTFLVSSRLVAMGVSTASLATALVGMTMKATRERSEFESAYELRCLEERKAGKSGRAGPVSGR